MAKKPTYNIKRDIPKFQKYRCEICEREYNNEIFFISNKRDCPLCDNRDCAVKID